ncbi:MAG: hypothetical protein WC650_04095 [Candidatus Doudnabacteria bacterium]
MNPKKFHFLETLLRAPQVNPVREPRSLTQFRNLFLTGLTVCTDGGVKPSPTLSGNDHRLKSVAFSNGVKAMNIA